MNDRVDDLQPDDARDVRGGGPHPPYPPERPELEVAGPPMDRIDPAVRPGEVVPRVRPADQHD